MKTRLRKTSGFTLIEIIIVVVILGILAAIALPRLTENMDKARAAEAFNIGGDLGKALDRCITDETGGARVPADGDEANCDSYAELSFTDPSGASTNFTYTVADAGAGLVNLHAALKVPNAAAADVIDFTYNIIDGSTDKSCGGKLAKMCKN